jgi:arginyl-tRNA synthetase
MMVFEQIAKSLQLFLEENYQLNFDATKIQLDPTRKEFEGDYTLVVFPLVKLMKTSPEKAGEMIGEYLQSNIDEVADYNVIKGFLNLSFTAEYWVKSLEKTLSDSAWFLPRNAQDLILVEYSSPNTNKPLHLGHLRNNFLGHSVSLIKAFAGNEVIKTQIINDRGVHICKSMLAWKRFGNDETPETSGLKGDKLVGKYYVIFDLELKKQVSGLVDSGLSEDDAKKEAPIMKEVQEMLVKWENGDEDVRTLWKTMNSWVYAGFEQTYERMGVSFDKLYYESETYTKGKQIVMDQLDGSKFFQKEDGSIWCNLESDSMDNKLLMRGDGTTVYMTQDVGTAVQRFEDYPNMTQAIYTVGDEQDYHFKVLFKILEKLGYNWAPNCEHLSYGMVDLPSGKMKSREGTVVDADDLMEDVVNAARASSEEKGKLEDLTQEEQDDLFEILGIGALKFFLLRVDPKKRMMFDPEESVSLNGDTGPFVQYTHARCRAVLRKAGEFDSGQPTSIADKERLLLRTLTSFRSEMDAAAEGMNPSTIANYCLELAKSYNQFYQSSPILKADGPERDFRLGLTKLTADTIQKSMSLLGIRVPERM